MPSYSNVDLLAVDAVVVPKGSLIPIARLLNDFNVVAYGDDLSVIHPDDFDTEDFTEFKPPDGWQYSVVTDDEWCRTTFEMVLLNVTPFGDGFGLSGSGLEYEIDAVGLFDALDLSEYQSIAKLAVKRLDEDKTGKGYLWRRWIKDGKSDPLQPFGREDFEVHLVLAYRYGTYIDDYNNECDVTIEYIGEVDLDKISIKESA